MSPNPVGVPTPYGGFSAFSVASLPAQNLNQPAPRRHEGSYYAGYSNYMLPSNYPMAVQQMNTAASQWMLEETGKLPWAQIFPTWAETSKVWLRAAQERWMSRRPMPSQQDARSFGFNVLRDVGRFA
jgi:hypothetical protein